MRKLALLSFALLISIVLLSGLSAAQRPGSSVPQSPHDYLSGLSAYVPQDALIYAAVRTDSDTLDAFGALLAELTAGLPDVPAAGIEDLMDAAGIPFDDIRPWLGDAVALAIVPDNQDFYGSINVIALAHLSDPAAAEAYLTPMLGSTSAEWRDDVVIFGDAGPLETIDRGDYPPLHDQPTFMQAVGALDAPDYAALVYADMPVISARSRGSGARYARDPELQVLMTAAVARMSGVTAVGFTRAENGDLVMDAATTAPNLVGVRPLGLSFQPQPVSPDALAYAPHDAFVVIQGANLPGAFVEAYRVFGDLFIQGAAKSGFDTSMRFFTGEPLFYVLMAGLDPEQAADLVLGNLLGVTLSDLQNWSSSDYVLFVRLNPNWDSATTAETILPVDVGGVFRIGRPEQSYAAFENLARSLVLLRESAGAWEEIDVSVNRTTDRNGQRDLSRVDVKLYIEGRDVAPLTISLAVTDSIAAFGTAGAVDAALAQAGSDPAPWLAEAAASFRPGATVNGAFNPSALAPVIAAWTNSTDAADGIRPFLAKIGAMTFNVVTAPNGASIARYAVTLNTAGEIETVLGRPTLEPRGRFTPPPPTSPAALVVTPVPTPFAEATAEVILPAPRLPSFRGEDGAFIVGSPDAPVTLIVFEDWACPHCQNHKPIVDEFLMAEVAAGIANFEHRTLPTAGSDFTRVAGDVAECAEQQLPGAFLTISDVLYDIAINSNALYRSSELASALSGRLGLDSAALNVCLETAGQTTIDLAYANTLGANSTPALFLRAADGTTVFVGDRSIDGIRAAIAELASSAAVPAAELADVAATQAMAGRPTATPTP